MPDSQQPDGPGSDGHVPDRPGPEEQLPEQAPPAVSDEDLVEVRRLLHAARVDEPTPPAVVARLDATLADLLAERAPAEPLSAAGGHDELAARRVRRRRVITGVGLVAAATIVAAGFLGQFLTDDEADTSSAGSSEETSQEHMDHAAPDAGNPQDSEAAPEVPPTSAPSGLGREPELSDSSPITDDEFRAVQLVLGEISATGSSAEAVESPPRQLEEGAAMRCGEWSSRATLVAVTVDGADRVLALEPRAADGSRSVHLLDCTAPTTADLQSFDVPAAP